MALHLVIYYVSDTYTRDRIREKIKSYETSGETSGVVSVTELSGSTYAIGSYGVPKTAAEILEDLKPYRDPPGDFRLFVIEVTSGATVKGHGDALAISFRDWMNTFK